MNDRTIYRLKKRRVSVWCSTNSWVDLIKNVNESALNTFTHCLQAIVDNPAKWNLPHPKICIFAIEDHLNVKNVKRWHENSKCIEDTWNNWKLNWSPPNILNSAWFATLDLHLTCVPDVDSSNPVYTKPCMKPRRGFHGNLGRLSMDP